MGDKDARDPQNCGEGAERGAGRLVLGAPDIGGYLRVAGRRGERSELLSCESPAGGGARPPDRVPCVRQALLPRRPRTGDFL